MLAFKIAVRFLTSNKAQMTLISLGIAVGVSVQIFIGALIFGLQDSLIETTVGTSPHIIIEKEKKGEFITYPFEIELKNIKNKSVALDLNGFIENELKYPILFRGFNIEEANKIYKIEDRLIEGKLPKNGEVLIGKKLAEDANLKLGDIYSVITPAGVIKEVKISGIFDFKVLAINTLWVISNIETVSNIFEINDVITSIELQVSDVFSADQIAKEIKTDLKVTNWKETNEQLLSGLSGQSVSSLMIQVFVLVSVVLGIASVLIISVVQKRKQIGILKAMGIKDRDAFLIFIIEGFLLGIIGSTIGVLFGIGLLKMFETFAVDAEGLPVVATKIEYSFIAISFIIAVVASTLASIIPSLSSKNLSPMEVIKNGWYN